MRPPFFHRQRRSAQFGCCRFPFGETFACELPPPLTPPHKGEGDSETLTTPSPLWGGVRGGGAKYANDAKSIYIAFIVSSS